MKHNILVIGVSLVITIPMMLTPLWVWIDNNQSIYEKEYGALVFGLSFIWTGGGISLMIWIIINLFD